MTDTKPELAPQTHPLAVETFIGRAIEKGLGAEELGKLVDLYERLEHRRAEAAYNAAMNRCQKDLSIIVKQKTNKETNKPYAPLEHIQQGARPVYTKEGFSLSFGTIESGKEGIYHVVCDCNHEMGHTKRYTLHNVPIDNVGPKGAPNKTAIQGQMSSMSYAQGRLIRLIFNITVADEDKDGQDGELTDTQTQEINERLEECRELGRPVDFKRFVKWAANSDEAESFADVPGSRFPAVIAELKRARQLAVDKKNGGAK